MPKPWTLEEDDQLKSLRMLPNNPTATQIAVEMGRSRNSVIGRLYRLEIVLQKKHVTTKGIAARKSRKSRPQPPQPPQPPESTVEELAEVEVVTADGGKKIIRGFVDPEPIGDPNGITIHDLVYGRCAWPSGDPRNPDFRYCGKDTRRDGEPYCLAHTQRAITPLRIR